MTTSRPSYAPSSARRRLPATERLRLRHRARRGWSVQALLDERRQLLASGKAQAAIARHAERVRHRLALDDSVLSTHGVRPWEQDRDS